MMRRFLVYSGVIAIVVAASSIAAEPQQSRGLLGHWGQFWGTWIWQTQSSGLTGPQYMPALITFHLDGTITGLDSGGGMPNAPNKNSPLYGVWERTGWQSLGGTSMWFGYNAQTGTLAKIGRARSSLQFSDDFNHFQGKMFVETLSCPAGPVTCPDPLDPAAQWVASPTMPPDGFPVTGTRLERTATGALPQ